MEPDTDNASAGKVNSSNLVTKVKLKLTTAAKEIEKSRQVPVELPKVDTPIVHK